MIDALRLSILTRNPDVKVEEIGSGEYWVRFDQKNWIVWARTSRWIEIEIDDKARVVGEMHFGSVSTFNQKCILRVPTLRANHGKRWDKADIEKLYEQIEKGITIETIAQLLGRSAGSVIAKAGYLLGLNFEHIDTSRNLGSLTFDTLIEDSPNLRNVNLK